METIKLHPECIKCFIDKHLNKYPDAPEEKRIRYMQAVLDILSKAQVYESAPEIICKIEAIQREMFGKDENYDKIKQHFNSLMQEYEDYIQNKISETDKPLKLAAAYSMLGNYIDFGAMDSVDEKKLSEMLSDTSGLCLDKSEFENLTSELSKAERMVFLTDNCGEIVTDKIFIKEIKKAFPSLEITAIVRGRAVLNDATLEDALQVGLDKEVKVIGNGSSVAGTALSKISAEALDIIDGADVIISKGQGNFETLCGCKKNIYYLFLCKCHMFAKRFGVPRFTGMLLNEKRI